LGFLYFWYWLTGFDYWPVKLVAFDMSDMVKLPPVIDVALSPIIDVALPPVILPIELMLSMFMVMLSCCAANAIGDAIPTTRETAATMPTIAITRLSVLTRRLWHEAS
jgi:hypothetical protein